MKEKNKHILKSIAILLSSSIYFGLFFLGLQNQDVDISRLSTYSGIVKDTGESYSIRTRGRESLVFYIDLKGLDQRLGIYRMNKDYSDLHKRVRIGDEIKVYYNKHYFNENVNSDIIQIEKNGIEIYSKKEYERKQKVVMWIGLIIVIITIVYSWIYYKKMKIFRVK
jgi:hypothetical protein